MELGVSYANISTALRLAARTDRNEKILTFSPLCVGGDKLINEGYIFKPLSLSFADDFWIAAFVGPEQVQVEHHVSTLPVCQRG